MQPTMIGGTHRPIRDGPRVIGPRVGAESIVCLAIPGELSIAGLAVRGVRGAVALPRGQAVTLHFTMIPVTKHVKYVQVPWQSTYPATSSSIPSS
jgi:hypothetical protein